MDTVHCQTLLLLIAPGSGDTPQARMPLISQTGFQTAHSILQLHKVYPREQQQRGLRPETRAARMNLVHLTMRPWFIPTPGLEERYKVTALNKGGRKLVQKQKAFLSLKLLPQTPDHGEITLVLFPTCGQKAPLPGH